MKPSKWIKEFSYTHANINEDHDITDITIDSRKVKEGSAFVCIRGFKTDGHLYIFQAIKNGAKLLIGEDEEKLKKSGIDYIVSNDIRTTLSEASASLYGHPSKKMKVIGVTGTKGKTTTTHLIWEIMKHANRQVALSGTNGTKYDDQVIDQARTTVESFELQSMLNELLNKGKDHFIMEVSSHALDLKRVAHMDFCGVVFMNLTHDHMDYHVDMEHYYEAKKKLFEMPHQYGLINVDSSYGQRLFEETKGNHKTFSILQEADFRAVNIVNHLDGSDFVVKTPVGDLEMTIHTPGMFSVYNSLAAIAVAVMEGIDLAVIKEALEGVQGIDGRFEVVNPGDDFTVVVDYAHAPDPLENVLKTCLEFRKNRVIVVFGCGGDRDRTKRPIMGEIATRLADLTIITSDNPRSENPKDIIDEIVEGAKTHKKPYLWFENRSEAIGFAILEARPGDIILIAGKGHETYQEFGNYKIHFDDREEAKKYLSSR